MSGTNLGKMPILIIALVTGIIMTTTAIVPLVSDYSDAKTFTNDGYFFMDVVKGDDTHTITWDHTDPYKITVDGEDIDLPTTTGNWTIIGSDEFMARYLVQSSNIAINVYGENNTSVHAQTSDSTDMTITLTADTFTATNTKSTPDTVTITGLEDIYCIVSEGAYVMKYPTTSAYLTDDSIIAICRTTSDSVSVCYSLSGTINDGFTIYQFYGSTATFGDITVNKAEIDGYEDLYTLDNFTFSITQGANTTNATVSYFIVPYEVTAETDNPAAYKALVKVVPVMAFVALIAAAAFMIYSKRD